MMVMILVVVGLISLSRLGLDFFPDIDFPTVSVITTYSGASSEDIETTITKPLEQIDQLGQPDQEGHVDDLGGRLRHSGRIRMGDEPRLRRPGHPGPDRAL